MSWKASAWAKETMGHGSYAQKLLLMMLAEYHNPELNIAFPSIKELSRVCEMSPRTVRWCLRRLEVMGFITTKQKGNQYQRTEYVLHIAAIAPAQIDEAAMSGAAMVAPASEAAMSGMVEGQRDVSEGATPVTTNHQEPTIEPLLHTQEVWPDWYATLYAIPGFKVPLEHAQGWLTKKGISEDHAETTAYALKGRWPGKYKDPWSTFQAWAKRPPLTNQRVSRPTAPAPEDWRPWGSGS